MPRFTPAGHGTDQGYDELTDGIVEDAYPFPVRRVSTLALRHISSETQDGHAGAGVAGTGPDGGER